MISLSIVTLTGFACVMLTSIRCGLIDAILMLGLFVSIVTLATNVGLDLSLCVNELHVFSVSLVTRVKYMRVLASCLRCESCH